MSVNVRLVSVELDWPGERKIATTMMRVAAKEKRRGAGAPRHVLGTDTLLTAVADPVDMR
jgi:hypothetical protein